MRYLGLFIVAVSFLSCQKEATYNNQFALEGLDKIEVYAYPVRSLWDSIALLKGKEIVENGRLNIDSTYIKNKIVLNKMQRKELDHLLSQDSCMVDQVYAACYEPRHLMLFRDQKNKIIAYKEFCFSCGTSTSSEAGGKFSGYCMDDMAAFVYKIGLGYDIIADQEKELSNKKSNN